MQILTPEEINNSKILKTLFESIPFYPSEALVDGKPPSQRDAREEIRRAVEANHISTYAEYPNKSDEWLLVERLARIHQNEMVINYNMAQLSQIYSVISVAVLLATLGTILLASGLIVATAV